ncbi:sterol desaturase family protein [Thiotrichales bacterium 19S3-7]|nr:sterol desaturase family protein [Thiotrichales bacterium 19S3-7]MCF6800584.1 sterol desaturase family protein [Thiotrichales bacterium 19S3-11]
MRAVIKNYFSHPLVLCLWVLFFGCLGITMITGLFFTYWYWALLPIIIGPFYEWYAHKFLLHAKLSKKYKWLREFQIKLHHEHHRKPHSLKYQFAPPLAIAIHLIQTYVLFSLITLSFSISIIPFTTGILYYLFYEWMHLAHHTPSYKAKTKLGEKLKRAHMRHHFYNENYCWGITNPISDIILGTFKSRQSVPKSPTTHSISGYHVN